MPAARASILQRPLRTPHPSAGESAEREYQEEQARLQAKRERYQETETFVRTMLNPSATERRNFQYVIRYEIHLQKHFRFRRKEHRYLPPSLTSTRFLTFAAAPLPHTLYVCIFVCSCRTTMENARCLQIAEKRQQERAEHETDVSYASPSPSLSRRGTTPPLFS